MKMEGIGKYLVIGGIILIIVGLLFPFLMKLGLGRLPGDIMVRRGNFTLYFPVVTSVVISLILTLILNLIFKRR